MSRWSMLAWQMDVESWRGVRIYRLAGVLTDSSHAYALISDVRSAMSRDGLPVLLDFTGVEQLTSAGVGMIVTTYVAGQRANVPLALSGLDHRTRRMLEMVGVLPLIPVFPDEFIALAAHDRGQWELQA